MYFTPSLLASAIVLSFTALAQARVAHYKVDLTGRDASKDKKSGLSGVLGGLLGKRQDSSEIDCTPNVEYSILSAAASGDTQVFCNQWLGIPPAVTETDFTPIITMFSTDVNTDLQTSTIRTTTTTTETIVETATITPAPIVRRAVNAQLRYNVANSIFESVLSSGTDADATTTPLNSEHILAEAGMTTACLCMNVDPTSTITSTFTAPAQETTVQRFVLRLETTVVTRSFTATTTITEGADQTSLVASDSSLSGASSTGPLSATVLTSGVLSAASSASVNTSAFDPLTTGTILPTVISGGGAGTPLNPRRLVATALPFNCPVSNEKSVTNVVGNEMYEYAILCDTSVVTSNEIFTIQTSSATDCAVECSFVNDAFQKEVCQAATFTAAPGADAGICVLSGATSTYVDNPGSITVILKAVYTSGNDCAAINWADGLTNATIDSSAAISSIKATSIPVMIPGLVTTSAGGGVFHTYVSAGETDSLGVYRYSWYEVYASSSYWGAVYRTAWSCTNKLPPRTIVVQPAITSVIQDYETTIIDGDDTYIIDGTSTRRVTAGAGAVTPTPVAASTTGGSAAFATGFSTATQTANAGDGVQLPSVTPLPSGASNSTGVFSDSEGDRNGHFSTGTAFSTQAGSNETLVVGGTVSEGAAVFSTAFAAATFNSTGNGGAITPLPGSTALPESVPIGTVDVTVVVTSAVTVVVTTGGAGAAISGGISISNATGGFGTGAASQTAGSAELTLVGGTSIGFASGGGGSIVPAATNGSFVGLSVTAGGAEASQAFSTATSNFIGGGGGYGRPTSPADESVSVNSTGLLATSGGAEFATSGSTLTANAIGGSGQGTGSLAPSLSASNTLNSSIPLPTAGTQLVTSGSQVFTVEGATATSNFTGGAGTGVPSLSVTASEAIVSGTAQLSAGGNTSVFFSTGGGGAVTPIAITSTSINATTTGPVFTNSDNDRAGSFSRSRGTTNATLSGTAPIGTAPPQAINSTAVAAIGVSSVSEIPGYGQLPPVIPTPSSPSNFTALSGTAPPSITVPPVSANATASPSTNAAGSISDADREGSFSRSRSTGGSGGIPIPTANITLWPGTSVSESALGFIPTAPANSSASVAIPTPSANTTELPLGTGSSSLLAVSANSTAGGNTAPPDIVTVTDNITFVTSIYVTVPLSTGAAASFSVSALAANSSIVAGTGSSAVPAPSENITALLHPGSTAPSSSVPTASANLSIPIGTGSSVIPIPSGNSLGVFSNSAGDRSGHFSAGTAFSTGVPTPSTNSTGIYTTGTAVSSGFPTPSANDTFSNSGADRSGHFSVAGTPVSSGFTTPSANATFSNSGADRGGGYPVAGTPVASSVPTPSANATFSNSEGDRSGHFSAGTAFSTGVPTPSANSTGIYTTGGTTVSLSFPTPSANDTFSNSEGDRSGHFSAGTAFSTGVPTPSSNSTGIYTIAGTAASSGFPIPSANATFSNSEGDRSGYYSVAGTAFSTGVLTPSANSTGIYSTGGTAVSSGFPTPSVNATFSNSEGDRFGHFSTGTAGSTGFPIASANSTGIYSASTAYSTGVPTPSANLTGNYSVEGTAVSSGFPTPSANSTFSISEGNRTGAFSAGTAASTAIAATANSTGFFPTGTGSLASSLIPTASLNSSTACSFTTPVVRTVVETVVITRLVTETPTACPTGGNATLPIGTVPLQPTYSTSAVDTLPPSATAALDLRRLSNVIATPEQITAACASRTNVLFNPDLELQDDNNAFGWTNVPQDQFISFRTFPSTNQHTPNGTRSGRILSAAAGRSIDISQPVTLCPGQQYELSAWNRQQSLLSQCTLEYYVGPDLVFTVSPQTTWLERSQFFTVPDSVEGASVDIVIRVTCAGSSGSPVGTDESGFMVAEFDDVSCVQV